MKKDIAGNCSNGKRLLFIQLIGTEVEHFFQSRKNQN